MLMLVGLLQSLEIEKSVVSSVRAFKHSDSFWKIKASPNTMKTKAYKIHT